MPAMLSKSLSALPRVPGRLFPLNAMRICGIRSDGIGTKREHADRPPADGFSSRESRSGRPACVLLFINFRGNGARPARTLTLRAGRSMPNTVGKKLLVWDESIDGDVRDRMIRQQQEIEAGGITAGESKTEEEIVQEIYADQDFWSMRWSDLTGALTEITRRKKCSERSIYNHDLPGTCSSPPPENWFGDGAILRRTLRRWSGCGPVSVKPWTSMIEYIVYVPEVYLQAVQVSADNPAHARAKVKAGKGQYLENSLEYNRTIDDVDWKVEEA